MNEMIDRYVFAVTRYLPEKQRSDVTVELRSSLLDELEERFGREATEEDLATFLRELGPPETVAASYRPESQYLIGPGWYPTFLQTLRWVIPLALLALAGVTVLDVLRADRFDPAEVITDLVGRAFDTTVYTFGLIVLIFVGLQRLGDEAAPETEWDPTELQPVTAKHDVVDRFGIVLAIVIQALVLGLLLRYREEIGIPMGDGEPLLLNDLFQSYLPWFAAILGLGIGHGIVLIWQGTWNAATRAADLVLDFGGLAILTALATDVHAKTGYLLEVGVDERLVEGMSNIAIASPIIVFVILVIQHSRVVWRMIEGRSASEAVADQRLPT